MTLVLGLLIAAFPVRFDINWKTGLTVGFPYACAKGGDDGGTDNSGHGNSGDDAQDNSGHGNGDDDGDDDDPDDDDNSGRSNRGDNDRIRSENNIEIRYTNGWQERIRNGRYRLKDPKGRTVMERRARQDDLIRMRQLLGQ